jgi:Transposase
LHDLLKPHVSEVLVCDPRKNNLGKVGSRNDRNDAHELAELLYRNKIKAVYHGEHGLRALKELARSYLTITRDLTRVMTRLKAIYRSWAIPCAGQQVYAPRHRAEWLAKISEDGVRRRAEFYYQQFDALAALGQEARRELLNESRKHFAVPLLRQIPSIGPIRAALLVRLPVQRYNSRINLLAEFLEIKNDGDGFRLRSANFNRDLFRSNILCVIHEPNLGTIEHRTLTLGGH